MSITEQDPTAVQDTGHRTRLERLRARYAPVLDRIREGSARRDLERSLPHQEIAALAEAGFGALQVPTEYGGDGVTLPEFFALLTDLAAADSNVAQALRGHFALVEDRLQAPLGEHRDTWLRRFAAGDLAGNAWTEVGGTGLGDVTTTVTAHADGSAEVSGSKYYSTGSIFAQWIDVYARDAATGEDVIAMVSTDQDAVQRSDDWTGFGQRTTGTGTTVFTRAAIRAGDVVPVVQRFRYQTAFYQQVLLATLAGVARAAADDVGQRLAARRRAYSHGAATAAAQDPQLLAVVGEVDAAAFTAAAVVDRVSHTLEAAADAARALRAGREHAADLDALRAQDDAAVDAAELASAQGQVTLSRIVPEAVTRLFDALGASATDTGADLDRYWRNARTAASHNPWVYKARIVGDRLTNRTPPTRLWGVGRSDGA